MNQLYEYLPGLLLVYAAFGLGLLTPGPNILAVVGTSMAVDRRSGMALAVGVAVGTLLWALLTVIGLSAFLAAFASAFFMLKIAGGLYLLWLAYKIFRSASASSPLEFSTTPGNRPQALGYMLRGLLIQMSNPKAALAWFAILPLCINADAPLWVWAAVVAGTTSMSIVGHLSYAIAFSTPPAIAVFQKSRRLVLSGLGAFFTFAGLKLLLSNM
ncbi:MAG: LysE family translocator [Rhodospirillales bacterium]|nr:LysE family translocator [Rhodospirillales bacterium]